MTVSVAIVRGPLPQADTPVMPSGAGAVIVFEGIVRPDEDGLPIVALDYEAYRPMADDELERIAERLVDAQGLMAIRVEHSVGRVPVGQCSFRLTIASAHRKEALAAMDQFIDALKVDVPIWKQPAFKLGSSWCP